MERGCSARKTPQVRPIAVMRGGLVKQTFSSWEPYARSIMRIILAFVFSLHGYRLVYGMFPQLARRGGVGRMPLDGLPAVHRLHCNCRRRPLVSGTADEGGVPGAVAPIAGWRICSSRLRVRLFRSGPAPTKCCCISSSSSILPRLGAGSGVLIS